MSIERAEAILEDLRVENIAIQGGGPNSLFDILQRIAIEVVEVNHRLEELENPDRPRVEQGKARE